MLGPISEQKLKVWAIMENILKQGKCRAIGVCDFSIIDLYELLIYCKIKPAINQVEFNPYYYRKKLWNFCRYHNIALEAYK